MEDENQMSYDPSPDEIRREKKKQASRLHNIKKKYKRNK